MQADLGIAAGERRDHEDDEIALSSSGDAARGDSIHFRHG